MSDQSWWSRWLPKPSVPKPQSGAISLNGISKSFLEGEIERSVLKKVDIALDSGQFIALLGNSGSGKSTLLNLISGIDQPSAGTVTVGGVEITQLDERTRTLFRRDHIGFIFQFFNLIPTLWVLENITLPYELAGRPRKEITPLAIELLSAVGLQQRQDTMPDKLSGGQQQRVAIARALVHSPAVILADEPTGNLDEQTGEKVLKLLLELTRDRHKTLIMATHNPAIAQQADQVLQVHEGHLVPVTEQADWSEVAA